MSLITGSGVYGPQTTSYWARDDDPGIGQQLTLAGNIITLSGGGGTIDLAVATTIQDTAIKTTFQSLGTTDTVFEGNAVLVKSTLGLGVFKPGGIIIQVNDGIIEGNNPVVLTRAGTLKLKTITDNNDTLGTSGQSLTAGAGGELVWATVGGGGGGIASVNAGTNISIPDPGIPVVAVAISSDLDMNGNNLTNGLNLGAESMVLTSDLAKAEFKNGLGVLKGSMGYNVGTDYMDLTGSAGFEINTTAGDLNMTANGGKINMTTNGNNIEIFGNTTGGFFADVNIGTSDGVIQLGAGGIVEFLSPTEVITKSLAVIETATPTLRFQTSGVGPTLVDVVYNPTGSQFSESALTTSAHEIGVYTGVVGENIAMGVNQALQIGYLTGQGLPMFVGESGASSYSALYLGNGNSPTDFLILDRKDNTDVTQTACSVALTGAGIINIDSQLATGGIGITTTASADISINSGKDLIANATTELKLQIGGTTQASLAGAGNIGVGGGGSDGSVFLLKNDNSVYGALNYNSANDTLNIDNGGSGISVGASGITMTPATGNLTLEAGVPTLTYSETTIPATATTVFNGTSLTTNMPSGFNLILDSTAFEITTTASRLKVNSGIVEGVALGYNGGGENYVAGYGSPMKLAFLESNLATDYILLDTAGITMLPTTGLVELKGDSTIPAPPTLKLTDTGVSQSGSTTLQYDMGSGLRSLVSDVSYIKTQTGAGDGMSMGTNGSTNLLFGNGFPMSIANSEPLLTTDYISLPSAGGIDLTTTGTTDINLNSAHNILLNSVNNLDITSANQITLTTTNSTDINITTAAGLIFSGAAIQSATSGSNSGQHLRIKLNGTFYKIRLEND